MGAIAGLIDVSIYEWIARSASAVALWASMRIAKDRDPLAEARELTYRLRHPYRWAALHPVQAIRRAVR